MPSVLNVSSGRNSAPSGRRSRTSLRFLESSEHSPTLPEWNWSPEEGSSDSFLPLSDAYPGVREEDTCI